MHTESHPLAGKDVLIKAPIYDATQGAWITEGEHVFSLDDWWDKLDGKSWRDGTVHATLNYLTMATIESLPLDDEVVYGKIGHLGHLLHVSQLGEVVT